MQESIRVADEVWIAVASLHRNHPWRADFTIDEIMEQAETAKVARSRTVASRSGPTSVSIASPTGLPTPERYRMLSKHGPAGVRLFRPGDPCHPGRSAGKLRAETTREIPACHRELLDWYVCRVRPPDER